MLADMTIVNTGTPNKHHGTQDLLAAVRDSQFDRRFRFAAGLGNCCHYSDSLLQLVGGIQERMVLIRVGHR